MKLCGLVYKHGSQVIIKDENWDNFLQRQQIDNYFDRFLEKTTKKNIMWMHFGDMKPIENV